jgi:ABC-type transport system involved in multi-copper enzyme maturation permease subunit
MNSTIAKALWTLEWKRLKPVLILFTVGYLVLFVMKDGLVHFLPDVVAGIVYALPFLIGLIMSSGMVSDDTQSGRLPSIATLPVSRSQLWLTRLVFRFGLFLILMSIWFLFFSNVYMKIPIWRHSQHMGFPPPFYLLMTGCLLFCAGMISTLLFRGSLESSVGAGVIGIFLMSLLQSAASDRILLIGYLSAIALMAAASRDLFVCREPLEWQALLKRITGWLLGILVLVLIMTFVL